MCYENKESMRRPVSEYVDIMTFATKAVGTFIIKKHADQSVKLYNKNKMEALDKLPNSIYVIDENFQIQYMNDMVRKIYPDIKMGEKCHEKFMSLEAPCDVCPTFRCVDGHSPSVEIYNKEKGFWLLSKAASVTWSGNSNMKLICWQDITAFK